MKLSPKRTDLTGSGSSIHSTAHSGNSPKSEPLNTLDAAMIRRWSRYGAGVHCYILSCCRVRQGCRSGLTQYLHVVVTKGIERRYAPGSQIPLKMLQLFHHPWLRCRRRAACRGLSAAWHRDRVRQQRRIRTIVRHWPSPEQENRTTARAFPAAKYE